jgi:hypothetical protein
VYIADTARGRRDGYAVDVMHVIQFEIRVVKDQVSGYGATNTELVRQCDCMPMKV